MPAVPGIDSHTPDPSWRETFKKEARAAYDLLSKGVAAVDTYYGLKDLGEAAVWAPYSLPKAGYHALKSARSFKRAIAGSGALRKSAPPYQPRYQRSYYFPKRSYYLPLDSYWRPHRRSGRRSGRRYGSRYRIRKYRTY